MRTEDQSIHEHTLLRIGAVCAILGAVISVAAGATFGNLTNELDTESALRYIASHPSWYWPAVHLGFIFGAVLWVGAFLALSTSFTQRTGWVPARLGTAFVILGAAIHIVDSSINGFALTELADAWAAASVPEQAGLLQAADAILWILGGTWASVITFFHGVPFILLGLAVVLSPAWPAWIGWVGIVGGAGSFIAGIMMFLGISIGPPGLFIAFAVIISLWMVGMGILMWNHTDVNRTGEPI